MNLLIDKTDIASYKDVSKFTTETRINEYINDSQIQDLCPLLGYDFYFDLLANKDETNYALLMDGGNFDVNGCTWTMAGIKAILTEFTWGRYTYIGSYNDTPNGNTIKTFEFSNPTPNADRKDIWKESKQRANALFEVVKVYLDNSDFDKWKSSCNSECGEKKKKNFNYTLIR